MNDKNNNLEGLIRRHGVPDAIIDNHIFKQNGYAIWGFDETIHYNQMGLYLNDIKKESCPLKLLQESIDQWSRKKRKISAIGFLSYDMKNILYPHINFKPLEDKFPYMWFGSPKKIKEYKINSRIELINNINFFSIKEDILNHKEYEEIILQIKTELKRGNTYQINFTMPKSFKTNSRPIDIYLEIRKAVKPDFGYYLNIEGHHILSFSPEEFFHTEGSTILTYPMKGTRPRGPSSQKDKLLKENLKNSEKDKAEHLMIVDLLRNDIGKLCEYGSVKVKDLFQVNSYATVHQMVSCVYGKLKSTTNYIDIFKALFPGGSITGAPKESSLKIIDDLEDYSRGLYTGTIGYIDEDSNMHFNMAIRTLTINNEVAKYCVGGGIVWDSDARKEWDEAQLKSEILKDFIN